VDGGERDDQPEEARSVGDAERARKSGSALVATMSARSSVAS
jgi:hypothetical protein